MTDLISREAAIALLRGYVRIKDSEYARGAEDAINHCIEALTNMPSAVVSVVAGDDPLYITNTSVESLGGEFEAVWDANADKLYEP